MTNAKTATAYATSKGYTGNWWQRSPHSSFQGSALYVSSTGTVNPNASNGDYSSVSAKNIGIVPALKLKQ